MKKYLLAALLLIFSVPAIAQTAFTIQPVNMRAGPDRAFPLVSWLPGGVGVRVFGCTSGWRWCDVASGRNRGWVFARYLSFTFQNQPMPIIMGGSRSGFPIVTFNVGMYWGAHYRGRPWYSQQSQWSNWGPPPPRPPSRPPSRPPASRPPPQRPNNNIPPAGGRPPASGGRPQQRPDNSIPPAGGRPPASGGRPQQRPDNSVPPAGSRPQGTPRSGT